MNTDNSKNINNNRAVKDKSAKNDKIEEVPLKRYRVDSDKNFKKRVKLQYRELLWIGSNS